jgi:DNA-binding CsgD family transcriptional regulator
MTNPTLNQRILDLAMAGHTPENIAELLNITTAQVVTAVSDLTNLGSPQALGQP